MPDVALSRQWKLFCILWRYALFLPDGATLIGPTFTTRTHSSMLSYRHSFHAGNHADVLKHTVQSLIIESLKEKEKPFLYLDTHAGAGRYQLSGEHAERTGEYLEGIARVWQQDDLPAELEPYIGVVNHFNRNGQLRYYLAHR